MKLENKVVIVTGAGRNIGEEIARSAVREGAKVALIDIDLKAIDELKNELDAIRPGSAMTVICNVAKSEQVESMVSQVKEQFGQIDVLINNVAITDYDNVLDLQEDVWDRVMEICLKSVFLCTKYVARQMVKDGTHGRIICMGSTSGYRGRGNATAYTAAKAGVLNLTKSLAIQLSKYGIRVNSITPNKIGSPVGQSVVRETGAVKNLIGRNGVPKDIANVVMFLASEEADFLTGIDILVDGGVLAVKCD